MVSLSLRKPYHGGSFEGNSCKRLLENLHVFEDHLGNPKIPAMTPYLEVLKLFNSIRTGCFSAEKARPDYKELIAKFKVAYTNLNLDADVSILVKVHELFFHVSEWIDKYPDIPIGLVCEQTGESLHRRVDTFCDGRMIKNRLNVNYKEKFFRCMVAFNGKQM